MAYDYTRYVNTDNGVSGDGTQNYEDSTIHSAYVGLSSWESSEQGTPTSGQSMIVYCCGTVADSSCYITGWASGVLLTVMGNRGDANGFYDASDDSWSTSHYRISGGNNVGIDVRVHNTIIDGVQLENNSSVYDAFSMGRDGVVLQNSRVRNDNASTSACACNSPTSTYLVSGSYLNNIILGSGGAGIRTGANGAAPRTTNIYNNTIYNCYNGVVIGRDDVDLTVNIYNNAFYSISNVEVGTASLTTVNADYNAGEQSATYSTTNGVQLSATLSDDFVDPLTTSAADVYPVSTGALVGAGIGSGADSNVPTTDLFGDARSSTAPTIGAFEYTAAAGSAVGSAAGTSTATAVGASTATAAGTAAGTGAVSGVGRSTARADGSATGLATAAGVALAVAVAVGSVTATSTASATGLSTAVAAATAAGTGAASGVGRSTAVADGAAAGTSTATAVGAGGGSADGTAAGTSTATAVGHSTAVADGAAAGTSTATAVGSGGGAADGTAASTSTATAVGRATAAADAVSAGTGTATAVGRSTAAADGTAAGTSTAPAVGSGTAAGTGTGTAAGTGAAAAVGASTAAATGTAAGTGAATGVSTAAGSGWLVLGATSLEDVVAAVWAAQRTDVTGTPGSMGEWVGTKLLTFKKWIGLK